METLLTILLPPIYETFKYDHHNFYHVWAANNTHHLKCNEFDFIRTTNSLGFSDREWTKEKGRKKRIIAIGDSFTEGDGAAKDSCYPTLLQHILNNTHDTVQWEILNAGACGSDPVFSYQNLQDRLIAYKPDVVLQVLSTHDLSNDINLRGGFERFKANGTITAKTLPIWFYPSVFSNLATLIITITGINQADWETIEKTERDFVSRYGTLADANNVQVIFLLMPLYSELEDGAYKHNFAPLLQTATAYKNIRVVDLMPCYTQAAQEYHGIGNLYWVENHHHNGTGYRMMAECIANAIK